MENNFGYTDSNSHFYKNNIITRYYINIITTTEVLYTTVL